MQGVSATVSPEFYLKKNKTVIKISVRAKPRLLFLCSGQKASISKEVKLEATPLQKHLPVTTTTVLRLSTKLLESQYKFMR
jgi:hypothetical protein